jgi:GDPmannose 4,6-dehydratase
LEFLPRKVAHGAAAISLGLQDELVLGDLDAKRDWGYAGDYVRAMWLMLQQDEPGDYVVASGGSHSVREFVQCAFTHVGLDWQKHVRVDPALQRGAAELHRLVGDASQAHDRLGWRSEVGFEQLAHLLVDADLERLRTPATSMER